MRRSSASAPSRTRHSPRPAPLSTWCLPDTSPSRRSLSIATGGWWQPTRRSSCCCEEWIRICCSNLSMCCAWRYIPMDWRRAPSISPNGGAHLLARLRRQIELTADPDLIKLLNELQRYPVARSAKPPSSAPPGAAIVLPFQLQTEHGIVSLISTVTVFGTPIDVTVAELALECF